VGIALLECIESQDPTALIGLPLIWLAGRCAAPVTTCPEPTARFGVPRRQLIEQRGQRRRQR